MNTQQQLFRGPPQNIAVGLFSFKNCKIFVERCYVVGTPRILIKLRTPPIPPTAGSVTGRGVQSAYCRDMI